ncbi:hypothetical protein EJ04DRAFT_503076 [Polyplosphaeria fusca]|uniref:F-box domain-containing protein n=1 Tax=Polyplosphaeria fusca TaxID=682080 RepID=A0A9P4UXI7_9PLEO|nr:hypothetical protein EJ04DRAFT_503076 [Polyplosphaeria fusca]
MVVTLPDDILHLLCEELASQAQFDALFSCACSSRALAVPALTNLYRFHHLAPVRGGGEDEGAALATKQLMVQKWSILWRSIIASSVGVTLFPYCRYIKTLDFRDLENLLDDDSFKGRVLKQFFSDPLSRFHRTVDTPVGPSGRKYVRLHNVAVLDAIGEVLTQHAPMLETVSGRLVSHALVRWAPRLPHLQNVELYDGGPLEDELVHAAIAQHCPQFNSLSIYMWVAEERDHKFATFIGTIRPQSLAMVETIRDIGASAETFLALNAHSRSLKDLRLCVSTDALEHLALLKGCTALESLRIEDTSGTTNLEKTQHDVFLEMIDWLRNCENLQRLSFTRLQSSAAIVAPLLLEDRVKLRKIEIDNYLPKDNQLFHQALVNQRSTLRFLSLSGDTEGMTRDDVDILVDTLRQLAELRVLKLLLVQEILHDDHLVVILSGHKSLEELYITGLEIGDRVLECTGNLPNLKSVAFSGISQFTTNALLDFVACLGPGNQGMRVMVDMADPDTLLTEEELGLVRESLWKKVEGTLEYTPYRDPNVSEFEGDSD